MSKGDFRKLIKDVKFRRTKVRLGDLLLQRGMVTAQQLQEALDVQLSSGKDKLLGQILVDLGHLSREELGLILAVQSGFSYIDCLRCVFTPEVEKVLPREFVEKYQVIPIDLEEDILTVAMVNPLDESTREEIEKFTQKTVMVFLTTREDFTHTIERVYSRAQ
jgi:hypothetical protein